MRRLFPCLAVAIFVGALTFAPAQGQLPNPQTAKGTMLDAAGDSLPPTAVARLGTLRFRHRNQNFAGLDRKSVV